MISDSFEIKYYERNDIWYIAQGNETFFDENDNWITFDNEQDARNYLEDLGIQRAGVRACEEYEQMTLDFD